MPEPGYDPNAVSSFYNPNSTPTPKLRPSGLGSPPSTADKKGSSAVLSAPKPVYSSNDNASTTSPADNLYSITAESLMSAGAGSSLTSSKIKRITPMNLYDQKNMQEMKTELENYLRGVAIEGAIATDMARMAVPEVYTGETEDVTVKAGDTLTAIAKDKGVSLQELIAANPQITNPDMIRPGEKVAMPSTSAVVETPTVDTEQETSTLKGSEVGVMSRPSGSMGDGESIVYALDVAAKIKNVDANDVLKKIIMPMAYHESDGTMDPTLAQYGGGPARGVMQYEPARFETSVKRAKNQFKALGQAVPQWIDNIDLSGDIPSEITSLSADQQMSLAVYDLLQKGGADIGKVLSGKQTVQDFWADHWWAGPKKQRKKRIAAFNRSQRQLNKNAPSNTTTFEFP
tara:strand:- start:44 stop:1246 length:1203 start_codon:yes stop_codon:yes gene_type:complete